jgi:hypothetical protein
VKKYLSLRKKKHKLFLKKLSKKNGEDFGLPLKHKGVEMKYTYTCYEGDIKKVTTRVEELTNDMAQFPNEIEVWDNSINKTIKRIKTVDELEDWRMARERDIWLDKKDPDDPNPSHYKGFFKSYQWLDVMKGLPTFKDPVAFIGALELQVRKYLDRRGQKGLDSKELRKALFYLYYLVLYMEGKEPKAGEVQERLK